MTCKVSYTDGRQSQYETIQQAVSELLSEYPDGVVYDAGGWYHDADDMDGSYDVREGEICKVWESEEDSFNDSGSRAVAGVTCDR